MLQDQVLDAFDHLVHFRILRNSLPRLAALQKPKALREFVEERQFHASRGLQSEDLTPVPVLKPIFTTIEQGLVLRVMGHLSVADIKTLREVVGEVIG